MTAVQKHAWFNLIVVAVTAITVILLYPSLGTKAMGGFGLLGFAGLGAFFHFKRGRRVVTDEREESINRRAMIWGYGAVWIAFVLAAVSAPYLFGEAVPTILIQCSVWVAFMLLLATQSIAALVQYGWTRHAE